MFEEKRLIFKRPPDVPVSNLPDKIKERKPETNPKAKKSLIEMSEDVAINMMKSEDDYFKSFEKGEFSASEKRLRTEVLGSGITIFRDIGLVFYKVVAGDTIGGIKEKLGKLPEFAYLKTLSSVKIKSFNIPPKLLQLGMWIPLPPAPGVKEELTESDFTKYCGQAIDDLKKDKIYGSKLTDLEVSVGRGKIIDAMITVAKAESGGVLGKFADRRYENGHKVFSYTLFHILMDGAGLRARRNLGMTAGQTLHPKNSAKLFLAFLFEKAGKNGVAQYFPLDEHFESFATFYNGNWQERKPPLYPDILRKHYPAKAPMASLEKRR